MSLCDTCKNNVHCAGLASNGSTHWFTPVTQREIEQYGLWDDMLTQAQIDKVGCPSYAGRVHIYYVDTLNGGIVPPSWLGQGSSTDGFEAVEVSIPSHIPDGEYCWNKTCFDDIYGETPEPEYTFSLCVDGVKYICFTQGNNLFPTQEQWQNHVTMKGEN